jgi:hypothetical protein
MNVTNANISVDKTNHMVRLYVSGESRLGFMHCKLGDKRPACFGQADQAIDLQIVKVTQHACSRTIVAMEDQRPVDGLKQTLILSEQIPAPNARCGLTGMRYPTKVIYRTEGVSRMNGEAFSSESNFAGPRLQTLRVLIEPVIL